MGKLTARQIESVTAPGRYKVADGLYMTVAAGGSKSWLFRYSFGGKQKEIGLGSVSKVKLAEAKTKADKARGLLAEGADPLNHFRNERARKAGRVAELPEGDSRSFEQAAREFHALRKDGWKNEKYQQQWLSALERYVFPHIGPIDVDALTTKQIVGCLNAGGLWRSKNKIGRKLLPQIESVIEYAIAKGYRKGDNPARWSIMEWHLDSVKTEVNHHAAIDYREMPQFFAQLQTMKGIGPTALRLTVLTIARTNEIIGARWPEVDGDTWTVPASRMKAGREHQVPLSDLAADELSQLRGLHDEIIFIGNGRPAKPIGESTMLAVMRRMKAGATVHGFRSAFRDWAGNSPKHYDRQAIEFCLAHGLKDRTEAAYFRSNLLEKRREILNDWAAYLISPQASA